MTNAEFSDTFTTLLNSYNTQAAFGEQASKREIVLDEYEKSVLLTQAQDIIVKSYFDATLNSQGQGFDDSTRRQVDFSSLIKVAELEALDSEESEAYKFDERGIIYKLPRKKINASDKNPNTPDAYEIIDGDNDHVYVNATTDVLFILNEKLNSKKYEGIDEAHWSKGTERVDGEKSNAVAKTLEYCSSVEEAQAFSWQYMESGDTWIWNRTGFSPVSSPKNSVPDNLSKYSTFGEAIDDGWSWTDDTPIYSNKKEYVIVPINYKEYDREMSKPYSQPLKKQAWRLFQNQQSGFDVNSELIPKWNVKPSGDGETVGDVLFTYKIRYVKRPQPIILEDLPDDLIIDGLSKTSECELNPILHMDILNKAVELAITTRGGGATPSSNERDGQAGRR